MVYCGDTKGLISSVEVPEQRVSATVAVLNWAFSLQITTASYQHLDLGLGSVYTACLCGVLPASSLAITLDMLHNLALT